MYLKFMKYCAYYSLSQMQSKTLLQPFHVHIWKRYHTPVPQHHCRDMRSLLIDADHAFSLRNGVAYFIAYTDGWHGDIGHEAIAPVYELYIALEYLLLCKLRFGLLKTRVCDMLADYSVTQIFNKPNDLHIFRKHAMPTPYSSCITA